MRLRPGLLIGALALSACAAKTPPANPVPNLQPRLDAADGLVRVGCFDCLAEALREYDAIRTTAGAPDVIVDRATVGAFRSAALLDLRERELGMVDDGYLARARDALKSNDARFASVLSFIETVPWRISEAHPVDHVSDDLQLDMSHRLSDNRRAWKELFLANASASQFDAYIWLALACASGDVRTLTPAELVEPFAPLGDPPLLRYKTTTCPATRGVAPGTSAVGANALADLVQRESRFIELEYLVGMQSIIAGKLEEANEHLQRAHDWRPRWPAVTLAFGNLAMTAEEFAPALRFYETTLELAPGHRDAMLGRARALTYLGRHEDAIQVCDQILRGRWSRGEAFYWRAWNDMQLERLDVAWRDVEDSWKMMNSAEVAKLAGMIAHRRQQTEVARQKFEIGYGMKPDDCEIGFLLGILDAELRLWKPTADVFIATASCLDGHQRQLTEEIARISVSTASPERKARRIARREQQLRTDARMQATSWFNIAVSYFNLSQKAEARAYAGKVSGDQEFGERAREILARTK